MLKGQTTIGRVSARCPAGTEPLSARLRLSHLISGADIEPRGFPPGAVLVIRRARAGGRVALEAARLHASRDAIERELREQVTGFWRRAVRPVRGRVPEGAEAVLFADEAEWLASLGLALVRREAAAHWCWRGSQAAAAASLSPSQAVVKTWAEAPRYVPAALVRLAAWGEAARVLGALEAHEASALVAALRYEFDLPAHAPSSLPDGASRGARADGSRRGSGLGRRPTTSPDESEVRGKSGRFDEEVAAGTSSKGGGEVAAPWRRWLPSAGGECERLHASARTLLCYAAALFHAPAQARGRDFAEEVDAFNEARDARARRHDDAPRASRPRPLEDDGSEALVDDEAERHDVDVSLRADSSADAPHDSRHEGAREPARVVDDAARESLEKRDELRFERKADPRRGDEAATAGGRQSGVKEPKREGSIRMDGDGPDADVTTDESPWARLEGCETRLGGALFLLNLLTGLRLPECFDEAYALSDHITGWGLTELLARELLGDEGAEFEDDPLWGALAHLDGRVPDEPPAVGLVVGRSFRAPARWLKLFPPREGDDAWRAHVEEDALVIMHAAGFPVAVEPLDGRDPYEAAALVTVEYIDQGVPCSSPSMTEDSGPGGSPAVGDGVGLTLPATERESDAIAGGRASAPVGLRRWMSWAFPFVKYALLRSLADAGAEAEGAEAARALLVRRGRLYCTATHVDLVLEMSALSFEARRAGLDASPNWVRDLMRVVTFHYE